MEESLMIPANGLELEARITPSRPSHAGIVAHPHPLYGGSMHNNVVQAACDALTSAGWTSLRFNFRGVGRSTGDHDQGLGEGDDLAAVVDFLTERGAECVQVIGYSFGAWVAAFAWTKLARPQTRPLVLIAPPAAFMSFDDLPVDTSVGLIVCGERDSFGPPDLAQRLGSRLTPPVDPVVIPNADHFFGGRESRLTEIVKEHLLE